MASRMHFGLFAGGARLPAEMRLLDRYLLRELLIPLSYCLGGFLIFWFSFNLFSQFNRFRRNNLGILEMLQYELITLPDLLVVVLPVSLLLGMLYALSQHARHNEITAFRAAGVSVWRIALPYLAIGGLFTVALFAVNEFWGPISDEQGERILYRHKKERNASISLSFQNAAARRDWRVPAYNQQTGDMTNPTVIWRMPDQSRKEIYAQRAEFRNGHWTFYNAQVDEYSRPDATAVRSQVEVLPMPQFNESPELIASEIKIRSLSLKQAAKRAQLALQDIFNYLRLHPELSKKDSALLRTQLHGRLALPWTCLVVVLLALGFGARSGRRNVFAGVASSIVICFCYFILQRASLTLGVGGYLPPWIAAWIPNLVFGTVGIILTSRLP